MAKTKAPYDRRKPTKNGVSFWMRGSRGDTLSGWAPDQMTVEALREIFETSIDETLPSPIGPKEAA